MMSLGELQISFPLFFCTKNSPNDIISGNFDSEVDQDEVFYYKDTVEPLLNFCNTNTINYPSIKRPPLLSGRGHPKSGPKCCFMSIFTSIKRPARRIYLAQHLVKRAENKSRASLLYL